MNASALSLLFTVALSGTHQKELGRTETVHSQPAWVVENANVRLSLTHIGAQMVPEFFPQSAHPVRPYYVSPWQDEGLHLSPPVLTSLRGDFFCLPFGSNAAPYRGVSFVPHGEPAGSQWSFISAKRTGRVTSLALSLKTTAPKGAITKHVYLLDGQNVVYSQERLDGYSLPTSIGHHSILAVPEKEGSLKIATSEFQYGMTSPFVFSRPENGEYQSFQVGKRFSSLAKVPLGWKGSAPADCTSFPARKGFADLLAVFSKREAQLPQGLAWTTATNDDAGYLWFSLRNPSILPTTVMWIENHGRHESPWNGRNRCLGLEDVCSYLNEGMPISAQRNDVNAQGIPTSIPLNPQRPTFVNYIAGVALIPKGFVKVRSVRFEKGRAVFLSVTGKSVSVPVNWGFVHSGVLR